MDATEVNREEAAESTQEAEAEVQEAVPVAPAVEEQQPGVDGSVSEDAAQNGAADENNETGAVFVSTETNEVSTVVDAAPGEQIIQVTKVDHVSLFFRENQLFYVGTLLVRNTGSDHS